MIDVADPTEEYSAARYAREAAAVVRDVTARGRMPILVGGTGLYYRALTRGFFPGPGRDTALAREARANRRPQGRRTAPRAAQSRRRRLGRPHSGARPQAAGAGPRGLFPDRPPHDRAFRRHAVAAAGVRGDGVCAYRFRPRRRRREWRPGSRRSSGTACWTRSERCWRPELPETAHPFTGLVYRQALEHLHGVRDEAATRELIVRENRRYSRRQLIWFRKEPNLQWIHAAGEREETLEEVARVLAAMEIRRDATDP